MARPIAVLAALAALVFLVMSCAKKLVAPDRSPEPMTVARVATAFTANAAPTVDITSPEPSHLAWAIVGSANVTIHWSGSDPDGPGGLPLKYRYKLFAGHNLEFSFLFNSPDSIAYKYAPSFAGWDSLPGTADHVVLPGLLAGFDYFFVIAALDDSAFRMPDPMTSFHPFSLDHNVLWLRVGYPGSCGLQARISTGESSWDLPYHCQTGPEWPPCTIPLVTVQQGIELPVHWHALPVEGHVLAGYRWAIDPVMSFVEIDGGDEPRDKHRWSPWSTVDSSAVIGPFHGVAVRDTHLFVLQTRDDMGCVASARLLVRAIPGRSRVR